MKNDDESVITMLHKQREHYETQQKRHGFHFIVLTLILFLDVIIIGYTKVSTLDGYAWTGIIFLFVLISVEGKQYIESKKHKESVDDFYLEGEYDGHT